MLIRATGPIAPDIHLVTLGCACFYLLGEQKLALVDCGVSGQLPTLIKRIESLKLDPQQISRVLLTHLHADRVGAIPYLKKRFPNIQICGSTQLETALQNEATVRELYDQDLALSAKLPTHSEEPKLEFGEYKDLFAVGHSVRDGDLLKLDEHIQVRVMASPGHSNCCVAYFTLPTHFLIGSEVFGYFRGRGDPSPGCDSSISRSQESIQKVLGLEFSGICLPYAGVLTGRLARKHLQQVLASAKEIAEQSKNAHVAQVSDKEIREAIWDSFFSPEVGDPLSMASAERSFEALWLQLLELRAGQPNAEVAAKDVS